MPQIKTYGPYDEATFKQIERCAGEDGYGVLCADNHLGYSQPIGGAVAYEHYISPSGVGFDIGCGNKAAQTDIHVSEIDGDLTRIVDEIARSISFGMGRSAKTKTDHEVIEHIANSPIPEQARMWELASNQLGTVGGGNHYVDLFADEDGWVWVGVHFGSRGFGHKTASGFLALAQGVEWGGKYKEGGMDAPPVLLDTRTDLGQSYIEAMNLAGEYAYAGRDIVVRAVLDILGQDEPAYEVHNHHNFAWRENHFDRDLWVIRKGCTPAFPGQRGFVGGSMGDISVILEGTDAPENAEGLYSTVHGAGRVMSRTEAAGKFKRRKTWECGHRDCTREFDITAGPTAKAPRRDVCPDHPYSAPRKVTRMERKTFGKIDWDATRAEIAGKGIELRGGGADEAPGAYKYLPEVLDAHGETISIVHTLTPIGVVMAGANEFDPYRD